MVDALTVAVAFTLARFAFGIGARKFATWATTQPKELGAAFKANYEDMILEHDRAIEKTHQRLYEHGMGVEALAARLDAFSENAQEQRVFHSFMFEGMREALDDRRAMLAAASAGLMFLERSVEDKARCERALRGLDVRHVRQLDALDRCAGTFFEQRQRNSEAAVRGGMWRKFGDGEVLAATCLRIENPPVLDSQECLYITSTGRLVLDALCEYLRPMEPILPIPGRERWSGSRKEEQARALLAEQLPGLREALIPFTHRHGIRYDPRSPGMQNGQYEPPAFDAAACLQVEGVDEATAGGLGAIRPWEPVRHEQMRLSAHMTEFAIEAQMVDGRWFVRVHGPHDVLRWLADDLDARWW